MALINCPECGKEVSDKVKACPHCGYPLKTINRKVIYLLLLISVLLFTCIGIFMIKALVNYNNTKNNISQNIENKNQKVIVTPENDENENIYIDYSAQNGFDGMNREVAYFANAT